MNRCGSLLFQESLQSLPRTLLDGNQQPLSSSVMGALVPYTHPVSTKVPITSTLHSLHFQHSIPFTSNTPFPSFLTLHPLHFNTPFPSFSTYSLLLPSQLAHTQFPVLRFATLSSRPTVISANVCFCCLALQGGMLF